MQQRGIEISLLTIDLFKEDKMLRANYDKHPYVEISGFDKEVYSGYDNIIKAIKEKVRNKATIHLI